MKVLIEKLNQYFLTNKNLKNFIPTFKNIMDNMKINLKNEPISGTYTRESLFRNEQFEIIFITWGKFCESPIHCHPENGCILSILPEAANTDVLHIIKYTVKDITLRIVLFMLFPLFIFH